MSSSSGDRPCWCPKAVGAARYAGTEPPELIGNLSIRIAAGAAWPSEQNVKESRVYGQDAQAPHGMQEPHTTA